MKSFAKNLIKRPLQLLAWSLALFVASQSFIVAMFFSAVVFFYLKEKALQGKKGRTGSAENCNARECCRLQAGSCGNDDATREAVRTLGRGDAHPSYRNA